MPALLPSRMTMADVDRLASEIVDKERLSIRDAKLRVLDQMRRDGVELVSESPPKNRPQEPEPEPDPEPTKVEPRGDPPATPAEAAGRPTPEGDEVASEPPVAPPWVHEEAWSRFDGRLRKSGLQQKFRDRWDELKKAYRARKWPVKQARFEAMAEFPVERTNDPERWSRGERQNSSVVSGAVVSGPAGNVMEDSPPGGVETVRRTEDAYERMALVARGKKAGAIRNVNWVANNIEIPLDKIDVNEVPSPAAVWMLRMGKVRPHEFMDLYAKLIPNRAQVEEEMKFDDDGEDVLDLLKPFAVGQAEAQLHQSEKASGGNEVDAARILAEWENQDNSVRGSSGWVGPRRVDQASGVAGSESETVGSASDVADGAVGEGG